MRKLTLTAPFSLSVRTVRGCQPSFMSSSLELKKVSIVSCYETRRPCLPFRVSDARGDLRGAMASLWRSTEATNSEEVNAPLCVGFVGYMFSNYPDCLLETWICEPSGPTVEHNTVNKD
ncbi:hypothetical protein Q8A67_017750 [Cirrhinus molitorella]|uniref:Uncharacterized protein n=1 Tax=Cirrhinus molitorella TaxID=172907 RepID=A0AA88PBM9_9TELE|nr:hypothetical protein Q8A67_017750 [Cirrhinus molitorella]